MVIPVQIGPLYEFIIKSVMLAILICLIKLKVLIAGLLVDCVTDTHL